MAMAAPLGAALLTGCLVGCGGPTYADPASESLVAARKRAHDRIDARLAEVRAMPVGLVPLREIVRDECVKGQHNWKVDDPYDSWCAIEVVAAFAFDGQFLDRLRELDESLRDLGWRGEGIREALDYWHECSAGSCYNFPDYGPADLPPVRYHRGDDQVAVRFASAETPRDDLKRLAGFSREGVRESCDLDAYHCVVTGTPWAGPWRSARHDHRFLLMLTFSEAYASTGRSSGDG